MMSRALFVLMTLAVSMPALAQTQVVTLKAADEVVAAILSPRGDRIAAAVGKDRIAVWSLPDGKLLQELKFPERTISALFAPSDQIIVALADGAIEDACHRLNPRPCTRADLAALYEASM